MKAFIQTLVIVTLAAFGLSLTFAANLSGSTGATELEVDPAHSTVIFRTKHLGVSYFHGRFNEVTGQLVYDESALGASSIQVEIKADSIDTNSAGRDKHLRSPDFFSVKEHPVITFASTKVEKQGDGLAVTGELTLHGVTKTVTAEAEAVGSGDTFMGFRQGFEATFTIDLSEYGMSFLQQSPGAVGPGVDITISLECVRPE